MTDFYEKNGMDFNEDMIYDYIKWGGFPLRFGLDGETSVKKYLANLYESIVQRDIVRGNSKIDKFAFKDIALYILANSGKEFSAENVASNYCRNSGKNALFKLYIF